ncbi:MAG: hypothetical protein HZB82_04125 [Deltaproteobacteria bacterium]|nr:hypothetical protein [Deltaproteobacteria bacterium]
MCLGLAGNVFAETIINGAGATFIIVYKKQTNCANAKAVLDFFDWAYKSGAEMARSLEYVPIPEKVYSVMEKSWAKEIRCGGQAVWGR